MEIAYAYHSVIEGLVDLLGMPRDLLRIHAGMTIYLGCLLLLGTRRGSLAAVLLTVVLALFHETMGRFANGGWQWHETARAMVAMLFWPTACYAVSSLRRWQWAERARQNANDRLLHLYDYRPIRELGPQPEAIARAAAGADPLRLRPRA